MTEKTCRCIKADPEVIIISAEFLADIKDVIDAVGFDKLRRVLDLIEQGKL